MNEIKQIIKHDLKAISKTIRDYCTDNFINSYAEQLVSINYEDDQESFLFVVNKLIEWYSTEITKIKQNEFVYGKQSHIKSYETLQQIKSNLDIRKK